MIEGEPKRWLINDLIIDPLGLMQEFKKMMTSLMIVLRRRTNKLQIKWKMYNFMKSVKMYFYLWDHERNFARVWWMTKKLRCQKFLATVVAYSPSSVIRQNLLDKYNHSYNWKKILDSWYFGKTFVCFKSFLDSVRLGNHRLAVMSCQVSLAVNLTPGTDC